MQHKVVDLLISTGTPFVLILGDNWKKSAFITKETEFPMSDLTKNLLNVDLRQGVVPISKAASSLAALIKRSQSTHQPIVVTQKGYPAGVIIDVELFTMLRELAEQHHARQNGDAASNEQA